MTDSTTEIRTIIARLGEGAILLPGSTVAEVVGYIEPRPIAGAPGWLLGEVGWNDWSVPVVSFAMLAGKLETEAATEANRILVIKSLSASSSAPYVGILISGVPRMLQVSNEAINKPRRLKGFPCVFREVSVADEDVLIPDLEALNDMLLEALEQD
jgi:chemosensory pili system protein ChpC